MAPRRGRVSNLGPGPDEIVLLKAAIVSVENHQLEDAIVLLRQSKRTRRLEASRHLEAQLAAPDETVLWALLEILRNGLMLEETIQDDRDGGKSQHGA